MSLKLLQAAEGSLPLWADGPLALGRQWVLPHLYPGHPCRVLRGTGRDGADASVMVVGTTGKIDHATLGPGFFAGPPVETAAPSQRGPGLSARLTVELERHDLVLARTWRVFASGTEDRFLTLPAQPEMRLPVGEPDRLLAAASPTIRRHVRRALRLGLAITRTTDEASFRHFYWQCYRPFVEARHGAGAVLHLPATLRRRLRRGAITWASLGGERIFGSASEIVGDGLRELVNGAPGGRVDDAARAAAYAVRLEHMRLCHAAGLRWLNVGGVAPWLSDGITRHKRAWGAELVDRTGHQRTLLVGWRRWSPALARFIAAFPLIVRRPWGFGAVVAAEGDALETTFERWRDLAPRGIARMLVLAESGLAALVWSERGGARVLDLGRPPASARLVELIDRDARPG